eukprot:COSAG05_NODE_2144_length_3483_cov_4.181147_2_plen_144_part_00
MLTHPQDGATADADAANDDDDGFADFDSRGSLDEDEDDDNDTTTQAGSAASAAAGGGFDSPPAMSKGDIDDMDDAFAALAASPDPQAFGRNSGADDSSAFAANFQGGAATSTPHKSALDSHCHDLLYVHLHPTKLWLFCVTLT